TGRTTNSANWHVQPDAVLEQVAFSDSSGADVMDGKRVLITTTAAWQVIVGRLQSDEQRLSVNLGIRFYRESFPEQGKRISIHRDGGESVRFVVLATSNLTGFTAVASCVSLPRDAPFFSPEAGAAHGHHAAHPAPQPNPPTSPHDTPDTGQIGQPSVQLVGSVWKNRCRPPGSDPAQ